MTELLIDKSLIGRQVQVPGKPDWGVGVVQNVQTTQAGGSPSHRITVRFPHGTRTLISPPARLIEPLPEPLRHSGWLETIGAGTLDHRLRKLPDDIALLLGTLRQRIAAVLPLYSYSAEPKSLEKWARAQSGVADPLSQWSRDELTREFAAFCSERDAHFRNLAAMLRMNEGPDALRAVLDEMEPGTRREALAALQRPI